MTRWIWTTLCLLHLGVGGLSVVAGSDSLSYIVAATIYLPLWPASALGLPMFEKNIWIFPPPNAFGWAFVLAFWALVYLGIATLLARYLRKRRHDG